MENRIKVLIADGSEAFCGHLKNELQQLDGYDLVGTAADGEEAVRLLEATKPDILVLDLMLAKRDGISVLRYANAMDKPPVGLVTSGFITDYVAIQLLQLVFQVTAERLASVRDQNLDPILHVFPLLQSV